MTDTTHCPNCGNEGYDGYCEFCGFEDAEANYGNDNLSALMCYTIEEENAIESRTATEAYTRSQGFDS